MNSNQELFWLIHTNVFGLNSISLCAVEGGSMRVINCTLRYIGASSTECSLFGEMFVRQTQLTIDFYNKSSNPHGCCPRGLRHSCPLPVESVVAETSTLMPHPKHCYPLVDQDIVKIFHCRCHFCCHFSDHCGFLYYPHTRRNEFVRGVISSKETAARSCVKNQGAVEKWDHFSELIATPVHRGNYVFYDEISYKRIGKESWTINKKREVCWWVLEP